MILTVKVGSSGATAVADSAALEELDSLRTFWSSAATPLTRKAAAAVAAVMLNFMIANSEKPERVQWM